MGREGGLVGAGMGIESFGPCLADKLYEVVVAALVLRQHYKMPAGVALVHMLVQVFFRHIHLAAYYGLEYFSAQGLRFGCGFCRQCVVTVVACFLGGFLGFFYGIFCLAVLFLYIVGELLYPVHCAVVGEGHAGHAVGHGFVYYARDGCLAVEHGVLRVYV